MSSARYTAPRWRRSLPKQGYSGLLRVCLTGFGAFPSFAGGSALPALLKALKEETPEHHGAFTSVPSDRHRRCLWQEPIKDKVLMRARAAWFPNFSFAHDTLHYLNAEARGDMKGINQNINKR